MIRPIVEHLRRGRTGDAAVLSCLNIRVAPLRATRLALCLAVFLLAVGLCADALAAGKVTVDFWDKEKAYVRVYSEKGEGIVVRFSKEAPQYAPWERNDKKGEFTTITSATNAENKNSVIYKLFEKLSISSDEENVRKLQKFLIEKTFLVQKDPEGDFGVNSWTAFIKAAQSSNDLRRDLEKLLASLVRAEGKATGETQATSAAGDARPGPEVEDNPSEQANVEPGQEAGSGSLKDLEDRVATLEGKTKSLSDSDVEAMRADVRSLKDQADQARKDIDAFKKSEARDVAKWSWGFLGFRWVGLVFAVVLVIATAAIAHLLFIFHRDRITGRPGIDSRLKTVEKTLAEVRHRPGQVLPPISRATPPTGGREVRVLESSLRELENGKRSLSTRCDALRTGFSSVASKLGGRMEPLTDDVPDEEVIRAVEGWAKDVFDSSADLRKSLKQLEEENASIAALTTDKRNLLEVISRMSVPPVLILRTTGDKAVHDMDVGKLERIDKLSQQFAPFGFIDAAVQSLSGIDISEDSEVVKTLRPLLRLERLLDELTAWRDGIPAALGSIIDRYPTSMNHSPEGGTGGYGAAANGEFLKLLREKLVFEFAWDKSISVVLALDEFVRYYMVTHSDKLRASPTVGVKESEVRSAIASIRGLSERLHFAAVAIRLFLKGLGINPHELKIGELPPGRGTSGDVELEGLEKWDGRDDLERAIGKGALDKILKEAESGVVVDVSAWGYNIGGMSRKASRVVVNAKRG